MMLHKPQPLELLKIKCTGECAIIIFSDHLNITNFEISASLLEFNAKKVNADFFHFDAEHGNFKINDFKIKSSDSSSISVKTGDIIL